MLGCSLSCYKDLRQRMKMAGALRCELKMKANLIVALQHNAWLRGTVTVNSPHSAQKNTEASKAMCGCRSVISKLFPKLVYDVTGQELQKHTSDTSSSLTATSCKAFKILAFNVCSCWNKMGISVGMKTEANSGLHEPVCQSWQSIPPLVW